MVLWEHAYTYLSAWWGISDHSLFKSYSHYTTNPVIEGYRMIFFNFFYMSPIRGLYMKSSFSDDVYTGKADFWSFTSYFFFFPRYPFIVFSKIWSIWSIMITCSFWIMLILRRFIFALLGRYSTGLNHCCDERYWQSFCWQ